MNHEIHNEKKTVREYDLIQTIGSYFLLLCNQNISPEWHDNYQDRKTELENELKEYRKWLEQ